MPSDSRATSDLTASFSDGYLGGINLGFELAARLVEALNQHAMTCTYLNIIEGFSGIKSVTCYEVFELQTRGAIDDRWLFRRFPLTLDDHYEDDNTRAIVALLFNNNKQILMSRFHKRDIILLQVTDVFPRRVVFIEGCLDNQSLSVLRGLHSVYAKQTLLLDTKERDSLTHLLNRQSLDQTLFHIQQFGREVGVRSPDSKTCWLAVLDIDRFKQINDTFGHIYGDEVLIHFANVLNELVRFSDFLFRFGGEEFIIILTRVTARDASEAFERFRRAIENYEFPSGSVTVSIGYTAIDTNKSAEQVLAEADKAVYGAKSFGRNCVVDYRAMMAQHSDNPNEGDVELF